MGQRWMIWAVGSDPHCSWKCTSVYRGCDGDRSIRARVKRDGAREVDKLHNYKNKKFNYLLYLDYFLFLSL